VTDTVAEVMKQAVRGTAVDQRSVYERMIAIIDELPAIGKTQRNQQQNFMFRGHDDVMNALNPLLAKHGVFVVPNVLERIVSERTTSKGSTMYEVNLHVRYTFWGAQGDSFTASGWGEGTDMGDKATSKAMTMAFKYVVGQAFALATAEMSDSDNDRHSAEETTRVSHEQKSELQIVGWKQLEAAITAYGASAWDDYRVFGVVARDKMFPERENEELSAEQKQANWETNLKVVELIRDRFSPDELPGPTAEDFQKAWQDVTGLDF
jgi:hypothetical protein